MTIKIDENTNPLFNIQKPANTNIPTTPKKINSKAVEALSSPPATPSRKREWSSPASPLEKKPFRRVMPPTPTKKPRLNGGPAKKSKNRFLGTELPPITADSDFIQSLRDLAGLPLNGRLYQLPSGQVIAAVQQPIQEKPTCGPGCVLMIATQHVEKLADNEPFWHWYTTTRLANASSLLNGFRALEIPAKICRLTVSELPSGVEHKVVDSKGALAHVKETILATNQPVILAITHPILMGHWIIVDGFDKGCALIRDPYTGKAFAVPEETLSKWLLEREPVQDMIYFS